LLTEGGFLLNGDQAIIPLEKLTEYALNLNHPTGGHKALLFRDLLGFTGEDAFDLIAVIRQGILGTSASPGRVNADGARFRVDIEVTGKTGKTFVVRTGWIYRPGRTLPRLTTVFIR